MTKRGIITLVVVAVLVVGGGWFIFGSKSSQQTASVEQSVEQSQEVNNANDQALHIVQDQSKATYELNELLMGKPKHVVGTTSQITGDITIDRDGDASAIEIGEVKIDATTFVTDAAQRDNNVKNLVLKATQDGNQFITFKTTKIEGVPRVLENDKEFPVKITGDMTVAGVTHSETFEGVAMTHSDGSFTLNASTTVTYGDYGLSVPNFSFLANVDKMVKLTISLVAK